MSRTLRQIYIPLLGCYIRKKPSSKSTKSDGSEEIERVVVLLHEHIRSWIDKAEKHDALRVISGGPGSGKTSFARMVAADLAKEQPSLSVLFIALHHFDFDGDLEEAIGRHVQGDLEENPLDRTRSESRLLIFFDGVDELAMQGKVGQESAADFIENVSRTVDRLNERELRLQVILGARNIVVEANMNKFRRDGQVLHVLPYFVPEQPDDHTKLPLSREDFVDNHSLLSHDLRNLWWKKYGKLSGKGYLGLPKQLRRFELDEITAQPLLNKLIAQSFERGKISFHEHQTRNAIYCDLIDHVYERGWGPRCHVAHAQLDNASFFLILEEVALTMWHGSGRTASVDAIQNACRECNLIDELKAFQKGAEAGAVSLLVAFFFRHAGRGIGGAKTFEFTHKSFGEYLVSRRIARSIASIDSNLRAGKKDRSLEWDSKKALKSWSKLTGPTSLDPDLCAFLRGEIALLASNSDIGQWQATLADLFSTCLDQGWPVDELSLSTFKRMTEHARNSEEALLLGSSACSEITETLPAIDWPNSWRPFGDMLRRLDEGGPGRVFRKCLNRLDVSGQNLNSTDLRRANLSHCKLKGANLAFSSIFQADLSYTDLTEADLRGADLTEANLQGAMLVKTTLSSAKLDETNLTGAFLTNAHLEDATLVQADLSNADLSKANLSRANFTNANLSRANMEGANFLGTTGIKTARLRGARLDDAVIKKLRIAPEDLMP